MTLQDPKTVLWANCKALMHHRYGRENLTKFAADCGMSPGNASRIKAAQTSVGIDLLAQIASAFDLDPWMLLVPGLDAAHKPVLQPVSDEERRLWDRLRTDMAQLIAMQQRKD